VLPPKRRTRREELFLTFFPFALPPPSSHRTLVVLQTSVLSSPASFRPPSPWTTVVCSSSRFVFSFPSSPPFLTHSSPFPQVVTLLSTLPDDSPIGGPLQNLFIRILWQDLPKPPLTFVGESRYRSADGSGNNPFYPKLGAAGQRACCYLLSIL
jgi:hypothetical protein